MVPNPVKKRQPFRLLKVLKESAHSKEKLLYRNRIEKSLILTLMFMIIIFISLPRMFDNSKDQNKIIIYSTLEYEVTPATSQGGIPKPQKLPKVPIPVEDEYLPADETIESTDLILNTDNLTFLDQIGTAKTGKSTGNLITRPLTEVFPEYPENERKRGTSGFIELSVLINYLGHVDSVYVLKNTTNSPKLEQEAIKAAYKCLYLKSKKKNKISIWIKRIYYFGTQ